MVSPLQNAYDLLDATPGVDSEREQRVRSWEWRTGQRVPASVRELYTTQVALEVNGAPREVMTFEHVWDCFSEPYETLSSLDHVLRDLARPRSLELQRPIYVLRERRWRFFELYFEVEARADPLVYVDYHLLHDDSAMTWARFFSQTMGVGLQRASSTFSSMLIDWIAHHYQDLDKPAPQRFANGKTFKRRFSQGVWLRSPAAPFVAPMLDWLQDQGAGYERLEATFGCVTHELQADRWLLRVTTAAGADEDRSAAWFLHAEGEGELAELWNRLERQGFAPNPLIADTEQAQELLSALQGHPAQRTL